MSVFWQHVGDANAVRDFPRTIGTPRIGLRQFNAKEIVDYLDSVDPANDAANRQAIDGLGDATFQIWGLPTGAGQTLSKIYPGAYMMLLDTNADWGAFRYVGKVLCFLRGEHWSLSNHLWKDARYPLIVLMQGHLIAYPWHSFVADFGFGAGFKPMGRTYRMSADAFERGHWPTDDAFVQHLLRTFPIKSDA